MKYLIDEYASGIFRPYILKWGFIKCYIPRFDNTCFTTKEYSLPYYSLEDARTRIDTFHNNYIQSKVSDNLIGTHEYEV